MAKTLTLTLGYKDTNFTRQMKFGGLSDADLADIKENIAALNASITGGTDDGLAEFFRSDDYDATDSQNVVGICTGIVAAEADETTTTIIDLS